jgi:hypothetical protein
MKECSICKTAETAQWYSGPICKSCYRKRHRQENRHLYKERDKAHYESNKGYILLRQKEYYENNTNECIERSRNHRKVAGDQRREGYRAEWKEKNREHLNKYHRFANAKRRARLLQATPKWLTKEHWDKIKEIYKNCPEGYEVDHIVPLQGENVCGLHVPWNLQYLTPKDNKKKKNKAILI